MTTQLSKFQAGIPAFILALVLATVPGSSFAWQDPFSAPGQAETAVTEPEGDALGRDTPRGAMVGFVTATEAFDYDRAALFLDTRNLPRDVRKYSAAELAEQLDFVFKRAYQFDEALVSRRIEGRGFDELPDYRDELGRLDTSEGEVMLLLQRVPGPDDSFIWKISNATVARIPFLYDEFSYPDWIVSIQERVPANKAIFGVELFKWIIVLAYGLIIGPLLWLVFYGISRLVMKKTNPLYPELRKLLTRPMVWLILLSNMSSLFKELGLSATAQSLFKANTLTIFLWVWLVFRIIDLARAVRREKYLAEGREDAAVLGRPLANALKLVILIAAMLMWLTNLGFNITTLLAGLGIGGVAIALALQKPIEDLLGALSIYSQQPVHTGDLCRYGTHFGRIEEVGLRTTRIRTLADTVVAIPNSKMAYGDIENFDARSKILYHPELRLRYDTTREQIEQILAQLTEMLRENHRIQQSSVRVRLVSFTENSVNIRARVYTRTNEFDTYLEIVEEVNLDIIDIVEQSGAHFAQGARTLFIENSETV